MAATTPRAKALLNLRNADELLGKAYLNDENDVKDWRAYDADYNRKLAHIRQLVLDLKCIYTSKLLSE